MFVVGKCDANLKEQVWPAFWPAHLLLLDHPPCDEMMLSLSVV